MARKITATQDINVDTEEEMPFNNFTIPVDHSDYDILEEEQKTMSKNDEVWIKTKQ